MEKLYAGELRYTDHGNLMVPGAYGNFVMLKSIFGGLEFMSVFLGIAFLVMLASTLMFTVLSNVSQDRQRYQILKMIGTTPSAARVSTIKDVGILFFIPMVIGVLDTVFGLQSFKPIMVDPYIGLGEWIDDCWWCLLTLFCHYGLYLSTSRVKKIKTVKAWT